MKQEYVSCFLQKIGNTTEKTKVCYLSSISIYSTFIGDKEPTIDNVLLFIQYLKNKNYSISSINRHMFAIKKFFIANKFLWDEDIKSQPINLYETDTPTISIDNVQKVITAIRQIGSDSDKAYLALSTIYGLRLSEMAALTIKDIQKNKNTIHIRTLKGGIERDHVIPPEIDFIKDYSLEEQSTGVISVLFSKICLLAGYNKMPNEGWHSIRRALVSGLYINEVAEPQINLFLRWAPQSIARRYYVQGLNPIVSDKLVFQKHPFLEFWR
ncbi:hypothetical protein COY26_00735 [Candidatus Woesearchaeota archaeon CG_4_10_14_0_2_um_filter_33_10]|nr:MAG: hypothetical protein COY26_00735 [Candidatus Woesearchaeota archaeon CG_4_10_14_0_2_um_filter_33_10]